MNKLPVGLQELATAISKLNWLLSNPDEHNEAWWLLCNETAIVVEDNITHLTSGPFDKEQDEIPY